MSFPKIPDIDPCINLNFEDAVNLLLSSIALEEVSISKLIDAETCKILSVVNNCCSKPKDILDINKSVDNTIQNMIKLQMLLQFKLEKVKEMLPKKCPVPCTEEKCSCNHTETKKICGYSLTGKGKGCISNQCDEFYGKNAFLNVFVMNCNIKDRSIRYIIEDDLLCFTAAANNIKVNYPEQYSDKIIIYGNGCLDKKSNCNCQNKISDRADFMLTVCKKCEDISEFKMEITSENNKKTIHDSGFVKTDKCSDLRLDIY